MNLQTEHDDGTLLGFLFQCKVPLNVALYHLENGGWSYLSDASRNHTREWVVQMLLTGIPADARVQSYFDMDGKQIYP